MTQHLKYFFLLYLYFSFISKGQSPEWKGITKIMDYNPSRLSTDSSSNSLLIANGPMMIENKNYYAGAVWDGTKFDSLAPYSDNYNILQIIRYNGDFYANTPTQILKKISTHIWTVIANAKNSATAGMCIYNNHLVVYGGFDSINNIQASHMAKFDGINWSKMDTTHFKSGTHILTAQEFNGNLYFGGTVVAKNGWCYNLGMFNGTQSVNVDNNSMAGGSSAVFKILKYKNALYMTGNFASYKGNPGTGLIKWDGFNWDTLKGGITIGPSVIYDFTEHKNELYFVGMFYAVAGMSSPGFFKFDGNTFWGHGVSCTDYQVLKCVHSYKDTLYVSGYFDKLCGDSARYIAKWMGNGSIFTNSISAVGVSELSKTENSIKIYPNPISSILHIESEQYFEAGTEIEITNALGQTILKIEYTNKVDVSKLANGIYTIKITKENQNYYSKFVKSN